MDRMERLNRIEQLIIEMDRTLISNITFTRVLFFISHVLYQSSNYYRAGHTYLDYGILGFISQLSSTFQSYFAWFVALSALSSVIYSVITKQQSAVIQVIDLIGLPILIINTFTPSKHQLTFTADFALNKILTLAIVVVTTQFRKTVLPLLHRNRNHNQFRLICYKFQLYTKLKIIFLTIVDRYFDASTSFYILICLQLVSTGYKCFYLTYCYPDSQWCYLVTEIWGWVSLLQLFLLSINMTSGPLHFIMPLLLWLYLSPPLMLVNLLEQITIFKLKSYKKKVDGDFHLFIILYAVSFFRPSILKQKWSNTLKIYIFDEFVSSSFDREEATRSFIATSGSCLTLDSPQYKNLDRKVSYKQSIDLLWAYLKKKELLKSNEKIGLQQSLLICYLLLELQCLSIAKIYESYYCLLNFTKQKANNKISLLLIENFYLILQRFNYENLYKGTFIEDLRRFQKINALLGEYVENEGQFYQQINKKEISCESLSEYLEAKHANKASIRGQLEILKYKYPDDPYLMQIQYITNKYVENNPILARRILKHEMNVLEFKRFKLMNFSLERTIHQMLMCTFSENIGTIVQFNQSFKNIFGLKREGKENLSSIIPELWRSNHQNAMKRANDLSAIYAHDKSSQYYLVAEKQNKYIQIKNLKISPYVELSQQLLLLIEFEVSEGREIFLELINDLSVLDENDALGKKTQSINENIEGEYLSTIETLEKTVEVFNKKYFVYSEIKGRNFVTTKLLEEDEAVGEEVEAIITMSIEKYSKKIEEFEKYKYKVNIFKADIVHWVIKNILIVALISFALFGIGVKRRIFSEMQSESLFFEQEYFKSHINGQIFTSLSTTLLKSNNAITLSQSDIKLIYSNISKLKNNYKVFLDLLGVLTTKEYLQQIIYTMDSQKTMSQFLLSEVRRDEYILNSLIELIKNNVTNYQLLDNFIISDEQIDGIYDSNASNINRIIVELQLYLEREEMRQAGIFIIGICLMLVGFALLFFSYRSLVARFQQFCRRIAGLTPNDIQAYKKSFTSIAKYLQVEKKEGQHLNLKYLDNEETNRNTLRFLNLQDIYDSPQSSMDDIKIVGSFYSTKCFLVVISALMTVIFVNSVTNFNYKMSYGSSNFKSRSEGISEFSEVNLNYLMISKCLFSGLDRRGVGNFNHKSFYKYFQRIRQAKTLQIEKKLFGNNKEVENVIFGSLCQNKNECSAAQSTNSFPIELNALVTMFYNLHMLEDENSTNIKELSETSMEIYRSATHLLEIANKIFSYNSQMIPAVTQQISFWLSIMYGMVSVMVACEILEISSFWRQSRKYCSQILSIISSYSASQSQTFAYELNCIYYKTHFASQLDDEEFNTEM